MLVHRLRHGPALPRQWVGDGVCRDEYYIIFWLARLAYNYLPYYFGVTYKWGRPKWAVYGYCNHVYTVIRIHLYMSLQYNTIRYDTIRYDTIRYDTIRYDTIRYDTIRYDTIRYDTIPIRYDTIRYDTIRYDTIRYDI